MAPLSYGARVVRVQYGGSAARGRRVVVDLTFRRRVSEHELMYSKIKWDITI